VATVHLNVKFLLILNVVRILGNTPTKKKGRYQYV